MRAHAAWLKLGVTGAESCEQAKSSRTGQNSAAFVRLRVKRGLFGATRPLLAWILTMVGAICRARRDRAKSWRPRHPFRFLVMRRYVSSHAQGFAIRIILPAHAMLDSSWPQSLLR